MTKTEALLRANIIVSLNEKSIVRKVHSLGIVNVNSFACQSDALVSNKSIVH